MQIKEQKKEHVCKFVPYMSDEGYGYEIIKTTSDLPGLGVLIIYEKYKEVSRVVCTYCIQCGAKV